MLPGAAPAVPSALLSSLFGTTVMATDTAPERCTTSRGAGCDEYGDDDDDRASSAPTQCSADFRRTAQQQQHHGHRADEAVFAVPGIQCVGCLIGKTRLAEVSAFVHANMMRAPSSKGSALWRLAADVYKTKVKIPCEREGLVDVPDFAHEQIWHHYRYHELIPQLTTVEKCRELRGIREMLTHRMVRYNADTKEREIDSKSCDQYMKVCALERTEHEALQRLEVAGAGPARSRAKGGSGSSGAQT